ncbi:SPOR domain-containing protein [Thiohalorhabdus sp.]|uniref:SPOR domain-containing protein n=1 Tax=Thiohalorhabdus sp. TaxID=3094134 RepID=UPI002FC37AEE
MPANRGHSRPARRRAPAGGRKRRRRTGSRGKRRARLQSFLWFAGGLGIGLAILLPILFITSERRERGAPEPAAGPADAREEAAPAAQDPEPQARETDPGDQPSPQDQSSGEGEGYRFYTLLPEMEVEVPEVDPESADAPETGPARDEEPPSEGEPPSVGPSPSETEPPRPAASGRYLLQVSALREAEAADKLKAQLAMQGLQARVVRADLGDKGVWHRVRLGPYAGRDEAERVQARLEDEDMEAMILKK